MEDLSGSDDSRAVNAVLAELEEWSQSVSEDTFLQWYGLCVPDQPHRLSLSRCNALVTPNTSAGTPLLMPCALCCIANKTLRR